MNELVILGSFLFIKHFIVDFPLQTAYMYENKGKWFHPGGILHSALHMLATAIVLLFWDYFWGWGNVNLNTPLIFVGVLFTEFVVHYVMDLSKVKICDSQGWSGMGVDDNGKECLCIYSNKWFYALGFDQLVHSLTYIWIIGMAMGGFSG